MKAPKAGFAKYTYGKIQFKGEIYEKEEIDPYIAYQKYKRCEAMADLCFRECQTYRALIERGEEHFSKMDFYGRWNKIWLILAEKFKEMAK